MLEIFELILTNKAKEGKAQIGERATRPAVQIKRPVNRLARRPRIEDKRRAAIRFEKFKRLSHINLLIVVSGKAFSLLSASFHWKLKKRNRKSFFSSPISVWCFRPDFCFLSRTIAPRKEQRKLFFVSFSFHLGSEQTEHQIEVSKGRRKNYFRHR
jgi:hypothetical protein